MKAAFIVNPAAGHGRAEKRWRAAARDKDLAVWRTERPGHAAELARRALEQGFDAIVAVGGDGTLGEVVNGYFAAPEELRRAASLGTWPAGSGCDTARHFGLAAGGDPAETLARLLAAAPRRLDAGKASFLGADGKPAVRHFLNIAAFGLAGEVALRTESKGKAFGGTWSYMLSSLGALLGARARTMELTVDGEILPRAPRHLVVFANTSFTGGGMLIAPGADAADGLMDLVTVGDLSRAQLLRRFPGIYRGRHLGAPGVERRRARRLEAGSDEEVWINIDGEAVGRLPATFEVLPAAVPFLIPAEPSGE